MIPRSILLFIIWITSSTGVAAFSVQPLTGSSRPRSSTQLDAVASKPTAAERQTLLARQGPHFALDRFRGAVEFGATANLVTNLVPTADADAIATWLQDERGLALSIWDPELLTDLGNAVYRMQVMKLQFVTLQLAPWVDVEMKTNSDNVFTVTSVNFDPNLEVLPGMKVGADALGIRIQVVGELRPSADGKGVTGKIAFETRGKLPPPLRILPEPALKAASDTINNTIVNFAIASFQKGATAKFREFMQQRSSKAA